MEATLIQAIVDGLLADRAGGARFRRLRVHGQPLSVSQGYDVQAAFVSALQHAGRGRPVGYKIGCTDPAMQRAWGTDAPVVGYVLGNTCHDSGAVVVRRDYGHLGVECEIAVRIGRDIDSSLDDLRDCIASVHAAFELVDNRNAMPGEIDAASVIAENSWNAGVVIGPGVLPDKGWDLAGIKGALLIDGRRVATGVSDPLGGPVAAIAWLAGFLGRRGLRLEAGQVVLTGATVRPHFPDQAAALRYEAEGLSPVEVRIS